MKKKVKLRMKTQKRRPGIEAIYMYMAYRTDVYCDFGIEKNLNHIQSKWLKLLIL